jgi:V8-like Glu-specific endopeptidase
VVEAPTAADGSLSWQGFHDRGELERQIFSDPTLLDIAFLERGVELALAVARLLGTPPSGNYYGTVFRIGTDLLLTNHHVLYDRPAGGGKSQTIPASAVEAWLRYEIDLNGRQRAHQRISCEAPTITGDQADDWAVIRTAGERPTDVPVLSLTDAENVDVNDRVDIIQHPKGGAKKIGMHHNIVRHVDRKVIQYWTDTEAGSSGAPVFNERWQVVALHHRWLEVRTVANKREYRNQGRRISRIAAGLAAAGTVPRL